MRFNTDEDCRRLRRRLCYTGAGWCLIAYLFSRGDESVAMATERGGRLLKALTEKESPVMTKGMKLLQGARERVRGVPPEASLLCDILSPPPPLSLVLCHAARYHWNKQRGEEEG